MRGSVVEVGGGDRGGEVGVAVMAKAMAAARARHRSTATRRRVDARRAQVGCPRVIFNLTLLTAPFVWLYSTLSEKSPAHTHSKQQARGKKKSTDNICDSAPTHHALRDHHTQARQQRRGARRFTLSVASFSPTSLHSPHASFPALPAPAPSP
jgi:hypothetical protein